MAPAMLLTFRIISTCLRIGHQECNFSQLLRHPNYYRGSDQTTKHANITAQTIGHIQPQIQSNTQSSIWTVTT